MVAITNLLGLAGMVAVAAAVGALAGNWWWSALVGGLQALVLAGVAQYNAGRLDDEREIPADVPRLPTRSRSA